MGQRRDGASSDGDLDSAEAQGRLGTRNLSLRANWRILAITLYMGISLFEYGFDKGAIAGFQAMPGFLQEFGYQTPDGKWAIEVCCFCLGLLALLRL